MHLLFACRFQINRNYLWLKFIKKIILRTRSTTYIDGHLADVFYCYNSNFLLGLGLDGQRFNTIADAIFVPMFILIFWLVINFNNIIIIVSRYGVRQFFLFFENYILSTHMWYHNVSVASWRVDLRK